MAWQRALCALFLPADVAAVIAAALNDMEAVKERLAAPQRAPGTDGEPQTEDAGA